MRSLKTAKFVMRIEPDLLREAMRTAHAEGESLSAVVRRFLRRYVENRRART